jgi:DNA-binding NarL/FixJ family response regulator
VNADDMPATEPPALERLSRLLSDLRELRAEGRRLVAGIHAAVQEMQHSSWKGREGRAGNRLQVQYGMTSREAEVARLLEEGCSNSAIAQRLAISPHTARHHTQRVLGKLGVHSRSEAGAILRRAAH